MMGSFLFFWLVGPSITLIKFVRSPILGPLNLLQRKILKRKILHNIPSHIDLAHSPKNEPIGTGQYRLDQLDIHKLVDRLKHPIVGLAGLELHHDLAVLGYFQHVQGELG